MGEYRVYRGCRIAHGAPMLPPFKFKVEGTCWVWLGATIKNKQGQRYGQCKVNKVWWLVHRFMYTKYHGEIEEGYDVHHVCYNTLCANPAHLQSAPMSANRARMVRNRKRGW